MMKQTKARRINRVVNFVHTIAQNRIGRTLLVSFLAFAAAPSFAGKIPIGVQYPECSDRSIERSDDILLVAKKVRINVTIVNDLGEIVPDLLSDIIPALKPATDYSKKLWRTGRFRAARRDDPDVHFRYGRTSKEEGVLTLKYSDWDYAYCHASFRSTSKIGPVRFWQLRRDGNRGVSLQYWLQRRKAIEGSPNTRLTGVLSLVLVKSEKQQYYVCRDVCKVYDDGTILQTYRR